MFLSFVKVQVKPINFMSKYFWISQVDVATELRWSGWYHNSYIIELLCEYICERIMKIGLHLPKLWSKVKCIVFWDTVYIYLLIYKLPLVSLEHSILN